MSDQAAVESTPTDSDTPTETLITSAESVDESQAPVEQEPTETPEPKAEAPKEYTEFEMPEGVEMDSELGSELKAAAKDMNLTQEQAQKLADLGAKQMQKFQTVQADALQKARETWESDAKTDKEFGGDKFGENLAMAKKAMDTYASSELKTLLNQTGLGNHPEFIRLMWKAGQAISEDRFDGGRGTQQAGRQSAAERLYGNTKT